VYCKKHMVFHGFYNLQNTAVMLNYNDGNRAQAQKHLDEIDIFLSLTENKALYLEKKFNHTHYEEFFNNNVQLALELCEQLEKELEDVEILTGEMYQKFKEHINEQKARCYTKMREPKKALTLFNDGLSSRFIVDHPLDRSLRDITFSYRASCYQQLGEVEKSIEEANIAVEKLKSYPHTAYYQFAREVLQDVKQLEDGK